MKKIFTILFLLISFGLSAQTYNNEWIDYSKTYYKFKVAATGLYRIPQSVLAGTAMNGVPAQNFQLFRNGKEVPLYTSVASGPFGGGDYIEFWGEMNDGAADKALYRQPVLQHTDHWSLETDTTVYFLTANNTVTPFHFTNTTNDPTGTTLSVEPYFISKASSYFHTQINPGYAQVIGEYVYSSSYDTGEFWSSGFISPSTPFPDNQSDLFIYPSGPAPTLRFGLSGCADNLRTIQVKMNGSLLIDTTMNSFTDLVTSRTLPLSLLVGNSASLQFLNNSAVSTDRMVSSFYELSYPRQFNFGGQSNFTFELPAKTDGYFLKIDNFNNGSAPVLYDLTNGLRYAAVTGPGSTLSFLLGGSAAARKMVLVNEDAGNIRTVTGLTAKNFVNLTNPANQGNYIIISNPILYTGTSGNNPVADYRDYRISPAGGSYNAHAYDINELVDQFSFGIKTHPLAIQHFLRYARTKFAVAPQYVLLIGHGMTYPDYYKYSEQLHDPLADKLNLVPTFGSPASDNKLTTNSGAQDVPITPIGRLSVVTGAEIEIYLQKLKEYEQVQANAPNTIAGRLWMKDMLHVTGASEPFLGTILCDYINSYRQIIEDTLFGGHVTTFCKASSTQIEQFSGPTITRLFNEGFSILTYFGHSSNKALGFDLDDPTIYNNAGKYPVFYINGCDAGNFFVYDNQRFATSKALSETYVLAKERGSIAFVAQTHFGIVNYLNILLFHLYNLMDGPDYGKSIGIIERDALQELENVVPPGDYFGRQHAEQMAIHGDPALKLNQSPLPDYDIELPQVEINPSFVSIADNSFKVKARFFNLGKAVKDSISFVISRKYPDGSSTILLKKRIKGIRYSDSVELDAPIVATRDKGQNFITVTINSDNDVPEITLANNSVTTGVYVFEDEANPIYPYNYAIINTPVTKLSASTADPLSISQQYVMEIDTTTLFNSSAKVTKTITSTGGLLEFDPAITYKDSTVYYWRVSKVPASGGQYKWNNFSFVYIDPATSSPGSNQSHFYQHTESSMNGLAWDSSSRSYNFIKLNANLFMKNGIFPTAAGQAQDFSVLINGSDTYIQSACGIPMLIFNVFDPITFHPWFNADQGFPGKYGSQPGCGPTRRYNFMYNMSDTNQRRKAMEFMDLLPPNVYVVSWYVGGGGAFIATNSFAKTWEGDTSYLGSGNSVYHRMKQQGFSNIDSVNQPRAFIFAYQKNNPGNFAPRSAVSHDVFDKISLNADYIIPDSIGYVTSPVFGPAKKWKEMHWDGKSIETLSTDSVDLQILGVDTGGHATSLYHLNAATHNFDISAISATQYPFLQLKMMVRDTVNATPYQLKYWRLNYEPEPEGALAPNMFLTGKDTLLLGEILNFGVAFKNVSPLAFDSMSIKLNIIDKNNVTHSILLPKRKPLISGDTIRFSYPINTTDYPGANTIYLDVNPDHAQPEQYHFNNFMYKTFYVVTENRNPSLDVTFDNVHILNEDIVSAKPHIQVKLKSPSQYLLLTDTSLIKVQLKYPDGTLRTFSYNTDTLRFTPASIGSDNTATIDFTPVFSQQFNPEGDDYQLIVTAKDELGNLASSIPYRVSFKVITKPMISNMLNYPNPFTTSTAFVFTITGSDVPQNIKIQVLTITGKIVREITKDELGPLHVGRNITEFKWNGTDAFGQRLANGVYLYHVVTNLNGKSVDKYKAAGDNTDRYFNNGYGKMYLMR